MICIQVSYWKGGKKWFADINIIYDHTFQIAVDESKTFLNIDDSVIQNTLMNRYQVRNYQIEKTY